MVENRIDVTHCFMFIQSKVKINCHDIGNYLWPGVTGMQVWRLTKSTCKPVNCGYHRLQSCIEHYVTLEEFPLFFFIIKFSFALPYLFSSFRDTSRWYFVPFTVQKLLLETRSLSLLSCSHLDPCRNYWYFYCCPIGIVIWHKAPPILLAAANDNWWAGYVLLIDTKEGRD